MRAVTSYTHSREVFDGIEEMGGVLFPQHPFVYPVGTLVPPDVIFCDVLDFFAFFFFFLFFFF